MAMWNIDSVQDISLLRVAYWDTPGSTHSITLSSTKKRAFVSDGSNSKKIIIRFRYPCNRYLRNEFMVSNITNYSFN